MTALRSAKRAADGTLVFVDSNILVYALDEADSRKQQAAQAWRAALWKSHRGRLSFQVLNEFYVNALRIQPAARESVRAEVRDLLTWGPVATDDSLLETGWKLQDGYQLSYWDALIVAAAKAASCPYLLSEDFQNGQRLDGIEVVDPFQRDPESVL